MLLHVGREIMHKKAITHAGARLLLRSLQAWLLACVLITAGLRDANAADNDLDGVDSTVDCDDNDPSIVFDTCRDCLGSYTVDTTDTSTDWQAIEQCRSIEFNLTIDGLNETEAENISRLRYLKTVGGSLIIRNNKFGATGLRGLDRLEDVGSVLAIEKNTLSSLYGLAALRTVGFSLFVNENASLASLQGLRNLASVGADLTIQKNPNLCQDAVNTFAAGVSVAGQTNLSSNNGGCSDSDNDDVYADDCNDANSLLGSRYNDADCDGVITPNDCDDNDGSETNTCVACVGNVYIFAPQDATGWVDSQGTDVSQCRSVTGDLYVSDLH